MSVRIDHFTTMGELNRYELILQKGGQEALADALEKENGKGYYRFGLDLASGVQVAALHNSGRLTSSWWLSTSRRRRQRRRITALP
jgi:hypothetical protein